MIQDEKEYIWSFAGFDRRLKSLIGFQGESLISEFISEKVRIFFWKAGLSPLPGGGWHTLN